MVTFKVYTSELFLLASLVNVANNVCQMSKRATIVIDHGAGRCNYVLQMLDNRSLHCNTE